MKTHTDREGKEGIGVREGEGERERERERESHMTRENVRRPTLEPGFPGNPGAPEGPTGPYSSRRRKGDGVRG